MERIAINNGCKKGRRQCVLVVWIAESQGEVELKI